MKDRTLANSATAPPCRLECSASHRKPDLHPFQQGDLDSLCGVYAIVNAVRTAMLPSTRLKTYECIDLFNTLILEAEEHGALTTSVTYGVTYHLMSRLLHSARRWVEEGWGRTCTHHKPFNRRSQAPVSEVIERISAHLDAPGTAVIIGTCGRLSHFTTIRRVTTHSIILNDSYGYRYFRRRSCDTRSPEISGRSIQIVPTSVYFLQAR